MSKVGVMSTIMDMLSRGEDIPFALRNSANYYGINIEQLKEIIKDVNQKDKEANYINSESGETGVPDSEGFDYWHPDPCSRCL